MINNNNIDVYLFIYFIHSFISFILICSIIFFQLYMVRYKEKNENEERMENGRWHDYSDHSYYF